MLDTIKLWHTDHVFLQACNSFNPSFVHTHTQTHAHTCTHTHMHTHTHTHTHTCTHTACNLPSNAFFLQKCLLLSHCPKEIPRGRFHIHPLPLAEAAETTHCAAAAAPLEGTDHVNHLPVVVISKDHCETSHTSMEKATQSAGVWDQGLAHITLCKQFSVSLCFTQTDRENTPSSAHQNDLSAVLFTIVNFFK